MMSTQSFATEYARYVEREVEAYKESIPRSALLAIGDEAVRRLESETQIALTELVLVEEVDRIIARRLRLPSFRVWRTRREKTLLELRRPETWGLSRESCLAREVAVAADAHVVVAGDAQHGQALFLAAHGCRVTTMHDEPALVERVLEAAQEAGLGAYVHGLVGTLGDFEPGVPLAAIVYSAKALGRLDPERQVRIMAAWQRATREGGVHVVDPRDLSLEELQSRYAGWQVSVERDAAGESRFLARKVAA